MTEKPGWGGGIAALAIGYGAGVAFGLASARKPAAAAEAVLEPTT